MAYAEILYLIMLIFPLKNVKQVSETLARLLILYFQVRNQNYKILKKNYLSIKCNFINCKKNLRYRSKILCNIRVVVLFIIPQS